MSELIQKNDSRATIRWKLLTGASAFALAGYIALIDSAAASDTDHSQIWIELGGQFEQMNEAWERFAPPFVSHIDTSILPSPLGVQHPAHSTISADGKFTFQPENSDWVFAAAVRFGRSNSKDQIAAKTYPASAYHLLSLPGRHLYEKTGVAPLAQKFVYASARDDEHHQIMDFQAGKDVGLGFFGGNGTSVVSAGVRFAQFTSSSKVMIGADPDFHFSYKYVHGFGHFPSLYIKQPEQRWHHYTGNLNISRSFRGIGPSISWEASAPFAGNKESTELTVDWGVNAALLFGRQRVRGHHDTQAIFKTGTGNSQGTTPYPHRYYSPSRSKSVTVPNVGGSLGLSFRYPNAKISIGYKADFFFNAIDGGIDARKSENRAFYGPYASISIGLGD